MSSATRFGMLFLATACCGALAFTTAGCKEEGSAEKTGKKIDKGMKEAGEKIEDAAKKTGDAIEDAGKEIKEKAK